MPQTRPPRLRRCALTLLALALAVCSAVEPKAYADDAAPPEDIAEPREPGTLRIVTYNILVAFGSYKVGDPYYPGQERKQRITDWLAAQTPDVVSLQEMNGYTPETLTQLAQAWGHEHAVILKPNGYPTALTSRWPIEVLDRQTDGLHHGVMRCRTGGVDYVVVHLWPFKDEARRMHEIDAALELAQDSREHGRPVVILGDFNALSTDDLPMYSEQAHRELDRWRWDLNDPDVSYTDIVQSLFDAGYTDSTAEHWPDDTLIDEPRVDFIFLGPQLADSCVHSRWVYSLEMIKRSDHAPVVTDLCWPAPADDANATP
ncbi:MAG: endonuclease/exonuclease/phosphatase family protein [Phycisphaerales bacterium JB063]